MGFVHEGGGRVRVGGRRKGRLHFRCRQVRDGGRRDERVESLPLGEAVADERLVRGVLEQATDEVRHPGHELADRGIDPHPEAELPERRVHRLGHAVEELDLDRRVGQPRRARTHERMGEAPDVVAAERRPQRARPLDQIPRAALVVRVRLRFPLEDGKRPTLGVRHQDLEIPVGALDEADGERAAERRPCPAGHRLEVGERIASIRLDDAAELGTVGELGAECAHELERQILHVLVLRVEMHRRARVAGAREDRAEPRPRFGQTGGAGQGNELRREGRRFDRHVDARHDAPRIAFELPPLRP